VVIGESNQFRTLVLYVVDTRSVLEGRQENAKSRHVGISLALLGLARIG
jgi:hypothetical protein